MSAIALVINVIVICIFTGWMHYRYGNWRKQHILVTLTTFVAWYFPFMIVFLMPIDVSNTAYRQCLRDEELKTRNMTHIGNMTTANNSLFGYSPVTTQYVNQAAATTSSTPQSLASSCEIPWNYLSHSTLIAVWHIVYWTCQALTWVILPMMQSYSDAGDFTVMGKFKSALLENALIYGSFLLILIICLIYLALKPGFHFNRLQLRVLAITASNTWGLTLLVLLLGRGLVDVPRTCWNNAWQRRRLARAYFSLAKLSTEKAEAEENLEDVLDDVKKNSDTIERSNPYREYIDVILLKCPESLQKSVDRGTDDASSGHTSSPTDIITQRSLIRLHRRVKQTIQRYNCTQNLWTQTLNNALHLEDIILNNISRSSQRYSSSSLYDSILSRCCSPNVEWVWHNWFYPVGSGVLACIMFSLSVIVVWSECLFFVKTPTLTVFGLLIKISKASYSYHAIEFVSIVTLLYLCICAYCTVFRVRIFNFYYLVGNHHTDENSLIFCGMMLCRLTPPICLNFLGLIHLDSHITKNTEIQETAFTDFMGHMDVISFISDGFNIYFPIAVLLLCIFTLFNVEKKILNRIGIQQFIGDDEMTQEMIDEGKELVRRERRKNQRQEEGETRRKTWNDKLRGRKSGATKAFDHRLQSLASKQSATEAGMLNDRTELLNNVGPVDYTEEMETDYFLNESAETSLFMGQRSSRSGKTDLVASRPRSLPVERRYESASRPPPKGIFDDI